jgi:hypothetical protein
MVTASAQQGVRTTPVMGWGIEQPEYDVRVARVWGSWSGCKPRLLESPARDDRCVVLVCVVSGYTAIEAAARLRRGSEKARQSGPVGQTAETLERRA